MMNKHLSRGEILLILVYDYTKHEDNDWSKPLTRYYVPGGGPDWSETLKELIKPQGSGDAAIFKSLARRGWIKKQPIADYAYALTEDGLIKVNQLLLEA